MNKEMKAAVDFLYATPKFTTKNSLDHTRELMELLGNPCLHKKVIHVAGSNGKGSVCCFIYHMLLSSGKKTALFTSPHLVEINERFQMNGAQVDDESFLYAFRKVRSAAEELVQNKKNHPTFFEFIFAMGMVIFERADVEYVVLETGLGGRLDATNSFPDPLLAIITSISLEHTEILGDTIAEIAGEKAGILKKQVPVVFDRNSEEAAEVIEKRADELGCRCIGISDKMIEIHEINKNYIDFFLSTDYDSKTKWRIPFGAAYQVKNAALAVTAMRLLLQMPGNALTDASWQQGLLLSVWPGRMQEVVPDVFFDGAHNAAGITVFADAVRRLTAEDALPPLLLFSMVRDKDIQTAVRLLTERVPWKAVYVTSIPGERGTPFGELKALFEESAACPVFGYADYAKAFQALQGTKQPGQKVFCTGSLYFIGALLEMIKENRYDRF